ncbi:MAG TPA: hypothetical protein VFK41_03455 [Nocardioidaceae bacterium]|nr:hypothetical protein [Nocardioidaceae bacterium]
MTSPAPQTPDSQPSPGWTAPVPLVVACAVAGLEALAYGAVGVVSLAAFDPDQAAFTISVGLSFLVLAGFVGFCAWRLRSLHVWARSPLVMLQLIQIPVAISLWGDGWWARVANVLMLTLSALALVGIFHPRSLAALEDADE